VSAYVKITGNGAFAGISSNISDYQVNEYASSIDPSQSSGGVTSVQFTAMSNDDSPMLLNDMIEISDSNKGRIQGFVNNLSDQDGVLTVTADSVLQKLNATKQTQPFTGTMAQAFAYYLGLCGITSQYSVDETIASIPVTIPGFEDVILDFLMSDFCPAFRVEVSVVYENIVLRPLRTNTAVLDSASTMSFQVDRGNPANSFSIYKYDVAPMTNGIVYPSPVDDASIISVDAGEVLDTISVTLAASLTSVNQPTCVSSVDYPYTGTDSVYVVTGNDGLPIPPEQWNANGGKVTVSIGEDTQTLLIDVTGMTDPTGTYAPYQLALSSGDSTYYNALYITGSGLSVNKELFTFTTGTDPVTQVDDAPVIDNPCITTDSQLYTAANAAFATLCGNTFQVSGTAAGITARGSGSAVAKALVRDFNDAHPGTYLVSDFNTDWSGKTVQDWNDYWDNTVAETFANQAFGNAIGARVFYKGMYFRVDSATIDASSTSFNASRDETVQDFNESWSGSTVSDFNSAFVGKTVQDFDLIGPRMSS